MTCCNLKGVVVATNIEESPPMLEFLAHYKQVCLEEKKIPLAFCLTKQKLGAISLWRGQKVSVLGILNFQGVNQVFAKVQ